MAFSMRAAVAFALVAGSVARLHADAPGSACLPARVVTLYNDRVYIEEVGYLDSDGFRPDVSFTPFFRTLNPAFVTNGTPDEIAAAAGKGTLGALLVVGANPAEITKAPAALKKTFLIVQDLFLTETAALADVVFPAATLYEKSGTVTNAFGDVQMVRKAVDRAGVKPDFEIFVRLADAMGADVKSLVPFGRAGTTSDLGQSRGAQAGEADRHAVWLESNGLEPRLSPFDPLAALDEIARLVPGYNLDRINLFAGNDVHTEPASAPGSPSPAADANLIQPAHDNLFTSGTLGQYTAALRQLAEHQTIELAESAAD